MDIHFVIPDLRRLDRLKSEALCLPLFSDERPLRGTLGLVDWRLCGSLSELVRRGRVSGAEGETTLVAARPRLPFEKLFVFGLGPRSSFDEARFDAAVERVLTTLNGAKVRASALVLPGRALEAITAQAAVERFLQIAERHPEHDEVTLVDVPEAQRSIMPLLERTRRRARALTEAR
jgi:leucyl aminopeptidase